MFKLLRLLFVLLIAFAVPSQTLLAQAMSLPSSYACGEMAMLTMDTMNQASDHAACHGAKKSTLAKTKLAKTCLTNLSQADCSASCQALSASAWPSSVISAPMLPLRAILNPPLLAALVSQIIAPLEDPPRHTAA